MAVISSINEIPYGQVGDTCTFGKHQVNTETPWDIEWTVVNRDEENKVLTLFANKIIDLRPFDAAEPSSSINGYKEFGNGRWDYSNIRQWLNSTASAGEWYSPQHSTDAPPNSSNVSYETPYQDRPGFLYNFSSEDRALLKVSTIITNLPSIDGGGQSNVQDMIFIPSITNLGGSEEPAEGESFQSYVGAQNADRIAYMHANAFANTNSSLKPTSVSSAFYYWTRSISEMDASVLTYITMAGSFFEDNRAYQGYCGVRPCAYVIASTPSSPGTIQVLENMIVLPAATTVSYLSPSSDLASPASSFVAAVDLPYGEVQMTVFATNNAYDETPVWENVTESVIGKKKFTLSNRIKTSDNWGFQIKISFDKQDASWVHSRGVAYAILDEEG